MDNGGNSKTIYSDITLVTFVALSGLEVWQQAVKGRYITVYGLFINLTTLKL